MTVYIVLCYRNSVLKMPEVKVVWKKSYRPTHRGTTNDNQPTSSYSMQLQWRKNCNCIGKGGRTPTDSNLHSHYTLNVCRCGPIHSEAISPR